MTREKKVEFRKLRAAKRRKKKTDELDAIKSKMVWESISFEMARAHVRGKYWGAGFQCEMRYGDCEERGYCNGDC
jgi:hypothetical protein